MMNEQAKPLIVGNWKMHGDATFVDALMKQLSDSPLLSNANTQMVVCPPMLWLERAKNAASDAMAIGAQDCCAYEQGARTSCVSVDMLRSAGCDYVILGHSERREQQGESNAEVKAKATAAIAGGVQPIICVGESLEQRESGNAIAVVSEQLLACLPDACNSLIIAYEPIWAIGTGKVPSLEEITQMHSAIHSAISEEKGDDFALRVLYGGSVKPNNATEILSQKGVNGALVGGASLQADSFLAIYEAA